MQQNDQIIRYDFYERLRINKIKKLCNLRNEMIEIENDKISNKEENLSKKNNESGNYDNFGNVGQKILQNEKRIVDQELVIENKRYQKELANIVKYELSKDLVKLEKSNVQANYPENQKSQNTSKIQNNKSYSKSNSIKNNNIAIDTLNYNNYTPIFNTEVDKHKTYNDNVFIFHQTKKNQLYEINQEKSNQRIDHLNKMNKDKGKKYKLKNQTTTDRIMKNYKSSNDKYDLKLLNFQIQYQKKRLSAIRNKEKIKEQNHQKREKTAQKLIAKLDHIDKLQRKEFYGRQEKFNNYLDRENKRGKVRLEKNKIIKSKSIKFGELDKQREKNISKIQQILKSSDEENVLKLLDQFPDNENMLDAVIEYESKKANLEKNINLAITRNKSKEKETTLSKTFKKENNVDYLINKTLEKKKIQIYAKENENNQNNPKKTLNKELEIKKKVREYQYNLYKEFYKKVEEEKKNEDLRNDQLNAANNEKIKNNLENQFGKERTIVDKKLEKEFDEIPDKVDKYEKSLRDKQS